MVCGYGGFTAIERTHQRSELCAEASTCGSKGESCQTLSISWKRWVATRSCRGRRRTSCPWRCPLLTLHPSCNRRYLVRMRNGWGYCWERNRIAPCWYHLARQDRQSPPARRRRRGLPATTLATPDRVLCGRWYRRWRKAAKTKIPKTVPNTMASPKAQRIGASRRRLSRCPYPAPGVEGC